MSKGKKENSAFPSRVKLGRLGLKMLFVSLKMKFFTATSKDALPQIVDIGNVGKQRVGNISVRLYHVT